MNYHNLTYPDMNNGDGLRVVLWLSGCSHHCYNCQNPQTWNVDSGIPFNEETKKELFNELEKDYISGLTLTGGDPLHENNLEDVLSLTEEIRVLFPEKTIWLYTGYTWEEIFDSTDNNDYYYEYELDNSEDNEIKRLIENWIRKEIIKLCNVLVDGKYVESLINISLAWRGSSNQRVINVQKSLQNGEIILWQ